MRDRPGAEVQAAGLDSTPTSTREGGGRAQAYCVGATLSASDTGRVQGASQERVSKAKQAKGSAEQGAHPRIDPYICFGKVSHSVR